MKFLALSAAALGLAVATAAPVHAQNVNANNLVSVTISEPLLENILNDLQIEVEDSVDEITVQAPIGVAANICPELDANVIAEQNKSGSDEQLACNAESSSQALNQIVKRQFSS